MPRRSSVVHAVCVCMYVCVWVCLCSRAQPKAPDFTTLALLCVTVMACHVPTSMMPLRSWRLRHLSTTAIGRRVRMGAIPQHASNENYESRRKEKVNQTEKRTRRCQRTRLLGETDKCSRSHSLRRHAGRSARFCATKSTLLSDCSRPVCRWSVDPWCVGTRCQTTCSAFMKSCLAVHSSAPRR